MGLFGIHLKDLEAIPGDLISGAENAFHGVFGGGNAPQQQQRPNVPQANGYGPPRPNFQNFQQNNGPGVPGIQQPNLALLQPQAPNFTPVGMKRDKTGKLIPQNGGPQAASSDPFTPVGNLVNGVGAGVARLAAFPAVFRDAGKTAFDTGVQGFDNLTGNKQGAANSKLAATNAENSIMGKDIPNSIDAWRSFVVKPAATAALTIAPGLATGNTDSATHFSPLQQATYTPPQGSWQAKAFGNGPIQNVQKMVGNNYDTHKNLPTWQRVGLAGGEVLAAGAQLAPIAGAAGKIAKFGADFSKLDDAGRAAMLKNGAKNLVTPNPDKIISRAQSLDNAANAVANAPGNTAKLVTSGAKAAGNKTANFVKDVAGNNSYLDTGAPVGGFPSSETRMVNPNDIPHLPPVQPLNGALHATPVAPAQTSMPEVNAAFDDAGKEHATSYKDNFAKSTSVKDLTNRAAGVAAVGQRVANGIRKALSNNLSKEEQTQVTKLLDGQTVPATQKAIEVFQEARKLHDQGIQIRQAIKPDVNRVMNYVPRYIKAGSGVAKSQDAQKETGVKAALTKSRGTSNSGILGQPHSISDLFNLDSRSSQHRVAGKFVADDGHTLYGAPKDIGLTKHNDGTFTNKDGKAFAPRQVSNTEMEANTPVKYEWNYNRIAGQHHADTLALKARAEALQELQNNRQKYGVYTKEEIENGEAPAIKDVTPVNKVSELNKDAEGKAQELFTSKDNAKALEDQFAPKKTSLGEKIFQVPTNIATQFIVLNPIFHGMNQLYQTAIAAGNIPHSLMGWENTAKGVATVTEDDVRNYLREGGHIPSYGSDRSNWLSQATHGVTKVNSAAMHSIELRLRVGLYKASVEAGMDSAKAIKNIDTFLGDASHLGQVARNAFLFAHYFKTMTGAMATQIRHPVENAGANVNTVAMAAITAAVSKGYQEFTGNPNAYARTPGELGLAQQMYHFGKDVATGDTDAAIAEASNRINPVIKEGAQQIFNHDPFTKGAVTDTPSVKIGPVKLSGRESHLLNSTIAPAQVVERGAAGKRSLAEIAANQLGINTPHAKGYQAAPSGKADFLNTKGSIKANQGDPTGYQQQQSYFKAVDALKKQFSGDKRTTDVLNSFLDRNHDPDTGQTISLSPADRMELSGALATNDKLRQAIANFEKSQQNHDPKWDLSDGQLAYKMTYDALPEGSPDRAFMKQKADLPDGQNWLNDLQKAESKYYDSLQHPPGYQPPITNGPAFPKFDPETQSLMDQYDKASPDQRAEIMKTHAGELATAWNAVAKWTNEDRKAQTGKNTPLFKAYPAASPDVQKIIDTYNAIPKGGGKKGGNLFRSQWIQAHPQEYAQMQNYLTQSTLYTMEKDASIDRFQGATTSQQELKDISSLGKYDVSSMKNADGTTSYALGTPPGFTAPSGSGGSGGFGGGHSSAKTSAAFSRMSAALASEKQASQNREMEHAAKAAARGLPQEKFHEPKRMAVHMRGEVDTKPFKVKGATLKARQVYKVAAKPVKALNKGNHAKLRT